LQGERFGGALDDAARQFSEAYDSNTIPMEFVNSMRKKGQLIMGIGHRVKSVSKRSVTVNPEIFVPLNLQNELFLHRKQKFL
jgi:citrate synthase